MKVIKAIYNFIVGDMVILIGVLVIVAILALFKFVAALNPLEVASGVLLIVGVLARNQAQTLICRKQRGQFPKRQLGAAQPRQAAFSGTGLSVCDRFATSLRLACDIHGLSSLY